MAFSLAEQRKIDRSVAFSRFIRFLEASDGEVSIIDAFMAGWDDDEGKLEAARALAGGDVCQECLNTGLKLVALRAPWATAERLTYIPCPAGCKPSMVPLWMCVPPPECGD